MSYRAALVDRGRRIYQQRGDRDPILGERPLVEKHGPFYRCRLQPAKASESRGENQVAREAYATEILLDKKFILSAGDKVEVVSKELGTDIWIILGDPQPLRRRRALIGSVAAVQRIKTL